MLQKAPKKMKMVTGGDCQPSGMISGLLSALSEKVTLRKYVCSLLMLHLLKFACVLHVNAAFERGILYLVKSILRFFSRNAAKGMLYLSGGMLHLWRNREYNTLSWRFFDQMLQLVGRNSSFLQSSRNTALSEGTRNMFENVWETRYFLKGKPHFLEGIAPPSWRNSRLYFWQVYIMYFRQVYIMYFWHVNYTWLHSCSFQKNFCTFEDNVAPFWQGKLHMFKKS